MHAKIIQVSASPIDKDKYIDESDYYESFVGAHADYVANLTDDEINAEAKSIGKWFVESGIGEYNEAERKVTIRDRDKYFKVKYESYKKELTKLNALDYEAFIKGETGSILLWLNEAYDDEYGDYYDVPDEGLCTQDHYLRDVPNGESFYIGGIVDYHW